MNYFLMEFINYLSIIPSIIIFVMSCYFLSKKNCTEAVLVVIGSGLEILLSLFYTVIMPYFIRNGETLNEDTTLYYTIANVVRLASSVFFALGFYLIIKNLLKTVKVVSNNPFNNSND